MNDPGWSANPAEVLRYRVIRALARHHEGIVMTHVLAGELGAAPREVALAIDGFVSERLAEPVNAQSYESTYTEAGKLSAAGRRYAGEIETAAASPRQQRKAAAAAMLDWLADNPGEWGGTIHDLLGDVRGSFFGDPFTAEVLDEVGETLMKHDLITGTPPAPIVRPEITTTGETVSERFNGDLIAWQAAAAAGAGAINITGSTSVNVAANSPGVHQTATTLTSDERRQQIVTLADALDQMMPVLGLPPEQADEAVRVVAGLRAAAEVPDASDSRLGGLMEATKQFGLNATSGAAGIALAALAEVAIHALGLA